MKTHTRVAVIGGSVSQFRQTQKCANIDYSLGTHS